MGPAMASQSCRLRRRPLRRLAPPNRTSTSDSVIAKMTPLRMRTTDSAALSLDPRRLTLARQVAGLKKVDLARLVGVTPAAISQYESGRNRPSAAVAAKLSLALSFPGQF